MAHEAASQRIREPSETEAIYLKTATQVVSRSTISGQITQAQFATALRHFEARYIILRTVIAAGHFVETPHRPATPVQWHATNPPPADAVYETLLNTNLDLSQTLYAVTILVRPTAFDIFLLTSHAITDATSLIELHACLVHFCDCVVRGETPDIVPQGFPDGIDDAVQHCLAALGIPAMPPTTSAPYSGEFLRLPTRPATGPTRQRLERLVIAPDDMAPIVATSHAHCVSVHSLLTAATALAIRQLAQAPATQILMRSSIDLRRRLEPHLSVELVFSAITGHVTRIAPTDATIFDLARIVHDDIVQGTADGRIFQDYENYPKSFVNPHDIPIALNISDMGRVGFHHPTQALATTAFDYATGWLKTFPNASVTIFDGTLVSNTAYREELIAPDTMRRLSELTLQNLRACETVHPPPLPGFAPTPNPMAGA